MFGISRATFYNQTAAGQLSTIRILGRRLVPATEITRLLEGKRNDR